MARRNFGFGRTVRYAGDEALRDIYGDGRYATVAAHRQRWRRFARWLHAVYGTRDLAPIAAEAIRHYASDLQDRVADGDVATPYAQNLVSTCNVVVERMSGGRAHWLSPSAWVGSVNRARTEPPLYLDWADVDRLAGRLEAAGGTRVAAMVRLARTLGPRFRESAMLEPREALRQAKASGSVTIARGVKGNHHPREVPVLDARQWDALNHALAAAGGDPCLIPAALTRKQWRDRAYAAFYRAGGRHFHDLRCAYACERYARLTGYAAPVLLALDAAHREGLCRAWDMDLIFALAPLDIDRPARLVVSEELGHHRIQVVSAYLGGRRIALSLDPVIGARRDG